MNLSKCTITPGQSSDYRRLALAVHAFAGLMLAGSAIFLPLKCLAFLVLLYQLNKILHNPLPAQKYKEFHYQAGKWTICKNNGQELVFEKHRVVLEAGLCFLIEFFTGKQRKTVVIFFDQLQKNDYRQLKLMEKIY